DPEQSRWADRLADSLRRTARWEDDCATWPQSIGRHRPGRTSLLVQHCHGAPGIVNCFAGLPDPGIDDLLVGAGELTWKAGPLSKGPGLCHGTAGNGYAFLKLFIALTTFDPAVSGADPIEMRPGSVPYWIVLRNNGVRVATWWHKNSAS